MFKKILLFLICLCVSLPASAQNCTKDTCTIPMSKEQMISEVVTMWNMWLDDNNLSKNEPRRKRFPMYAKHLVNAVKLYQSKELIVGGQLPKGNNVHLIIASMVMYETAIRHWILGWKKNEVGLLQIHGKEALMRHNPKKVRYNPRLGIKLGVRWLAYHTQFCIPNPTDNIDQWAKVLSLYSAGVRRGRNKDGTCKRIRVARDRVDTAKVYAKRIRK